AVTEISTRAQIFRRNWGGIFPQHRHDVLSRHGAQLEALGIEYVADGLLASTVRESRREGGDNVAGGAGIVKRIVVLEAAKTYCLGHRRQLVVGYLEYFAFRCIPCQRQRTRQRNLRYGHLGAQKCRAQSRRIELRIVCDEDIITQENQ